MRLAPTAGLLVAGRAIQGLGGAAVSAVALSLIMGLFSDPGERAKAMGFFGFVMSGGGAVGVLPAAYSPDSSTGTGSSWSTSRSASPSGSPPARVLPSDESAPQAGRLDVPAPYWSPSR